MARFGGGPDRNTTRQLMQMMETVQNQVRDLKGFSERSDRETLGKAENIGNEMKQMLGR